MEKMNIEQEIIHEMTQLLEKMAVESFAPVITDETSDAQMLEAILICLKTINARYDKNEAVVQVNSLMEKYNIQIDELMEHIRH
jgi:hypothetical protein